jgi:hypothetical protein
VLTLGTNSYLAKRRVIVCPMSVEMEGQQGARSATIFLEVSC